MIMEEVVNRVRDMDKELKLEGFEGVRIMNGLGLMASKDESNTMAAVMGGFGKGFV